jgi:hypothetical protein
MIYFTCEAQLLGSSDTGSKHGQLILFQSVYMRFKFLIPAPTPQAHEFHEFQKTMLRKGDESICDSKSGATEENSDKAGKEDHMKEQSSFPSCQGV